VLTCAGFVIGTSGLAAAAFPGRNGEIAWGFYHGSPPCPFNEVCREAWEIKSQSLSKQKRHVLACNALGPAYSRNGRRLVFWEGLKGAFVGSADAFRTPTFVPNTERGDDVTWSPSGKRLALEFLPTDNSETTNIYSIRPDGTQLRQLTFDNRSFGPAWGPTGRIAFGSLSHPGIWVMNADGSGRRRLTHAGHWKSDPQATVEDQPQSWSPDGNWIAFVRMPTDYYTDLYVVRADGRHLKRIARGDGEAAWSPNGKWIAVAPRYGFTISLVRPDGSHRHPVITEPQYGSRKCHNQALSGADEGAGFGGLDWQPLPQR